MCSPRTHLCFVVTKWAKYLYTAFIKVCASSKNQWLLKISWLAFRYFKFSSALHEDVGWFLISFTILGTDLHRDWIWTQWPFYGPSNSKYSMNEFTFFVWELLLWNKHTTLHIVYLLEILLAVIFMQKKLSNIWEQLENSIGYRKRNI